MYGIIDHQAPRSATVLTCSVSTQQKAAQRGFSLVEVLAVVAIIGILAAIAVSNFGSIRSDARDKYVMTTMQSIIIEATLYRANTGGYVDFCAAMGVILADIDASAAVASSCESAAGGYEVHAGLSSGVTYCVDQTRYVGNTADANVSDFSC